MRSSFLTLATNVLLLQWMCSEIVAVSRSPGEVLPQSIEMKIGDSANITCSMNLQRFSGSQSSSLYFVEQGSGLKVPKQDIAILNSTTIVYMIRNATEQQTEYVCKSGPNAIGLTKVYVGTPPTDVKDFKCRAYDFTYMLCNFTVPANMILTQYNLSYIATSPNYVQICDLEIQGQHGICELSLDKSNYRPNYDFYNFTLIGGNLIGTNRQNFWVNHYEIVIPPRPNVQFEQITDKSVVLSWNLVTYSYYSKGLQYEVCIRPDGFEWMNHSEYEIRTNKSEYKLKLRDLPYAFYWYNVTMRMKMRSARDDTMWSDKFSEKFQTKAKLPESAPALDVGSFYVDSSETNLRIYWRQIPTYYENGPNFEYIVKSVRCDGEEIKMLPTQIDRISATFAWDKTRYYEFTIKSRNDIGESLDSQKIIVYPTRTNHEEKAPKWIRNVYHAPNHTYTLSWSPPLEADKLVDYTVFWCQSKRATLNECRGSIQFEHVNKNTTNFTTALQKQDHALNFAVSANYMDYNTGMRWTMCTADVTSDLVKLDPEIIPLSARSIQVQWSPDRVCSSLLEGYNITYCRIQDDFNASSENPKCADKSKTITVEKTAKKYLLRDLNPFSNYKVEMYMFSKLKRGKISDPFVVKTTEEAPSPPRNLKFTNITSNSALISWLPPTQMNGKLRHFAVIQNEQHIIKCKIAKENICSNDTEKEVTFKLENLSSFTNYKIYIIAHTVADSFPSNDIHFKTLIGIPSNPRHMVPAVNNHTIMQWSPPIVPSGRVEFYEVAVIVWYKDEMQRQRISGVVDATSCIVIVPTCPDTDYKHTLQVRAVNVASRHSEVDHDVFASNLTEEEDFDAVFYEGNDDLKCIGTSLPDKEQMAIVRRYRNTNNFKQYKSVWEKGPTYGCAATTKLSRITSIALLVFIMSLGVMAAFYIARKKYNKMANINCALPAGLDSLTYPAKSSDISNVSDKEDEELHRSKESLFGTEKHHLLSSIFNDSGYMCGGSGEAANNSGPCSLGRSSGYVGSDRSEDYSKHMQRPAEPQDADKSYMVMDVLKSKREHCPTITDEGYIKASAAADSFLILKPDSVSMIPSTNGYIKPNKLFHWPTQSSEQSKSAPQSMESSGHTQTALLGKDAVKSPVDGYTTLDDFGKPSLGSSVHTSAAPHDLRGFSSSAKPISGYVTQKELSVFGQQRLS